MFGFIADFIASFVTILFPIFASYKALRASDPAQLTPWLIYWVILSIFLLIESWTVFIIGWLPFYSWFRLFGLSYLVLPQTQGAKLLYTQHVEPFIARYEHQIERFIGDLHEKASKFGLDHIQQIINLIRERFLGLPPTPTASSQPGAAGYAQSLLSRFTMPAARGGPADIYSLLSSAVGSGAGPTASTSARSDPFGATIPPNLTSTSDKQTYLSSQRERLSQLMTAVDREQRDLDLAYGRAPPPENLSDRDGSRRAHEGGGRDAYSSSYGDGHGSRHVSGGSSGGGGGGVEMRKNRSDNSFQNIEREEADSADHRDREREREGDRRRKEAKRTNSGGGGGGGGGWLPNSWFPGGEGGAGAGGVGDMLKDGIDAVREGADRKRR